MAAATLLGAAALAAAVSDSPLQASDSDGPFAQDFSRLTPPVPAPLEVFRDLDGGRVRLADFEGGVVLVNFWATWCAPCIKEMPALDRLQALLRPEGLTVIAVSIDRGGKEVVEPFARKLGLENLALYLDPKSALARAFGIAGLPTTFLVDAESRVVRGLAGAAEWDSDEAVGLIRHYLKSDGEGEESDLLNAELLGGS